MQKTLQSFPMIKLNSTAFSIRFPLVKSDVHSVSESYIMLSCLHELDVIGFEITIHAGKVNLWMTATEDADDYRRYVAQLILKEMQGLGDNEVDNFIRLHDIEAVDIKPYIQPSKTLGEILEELKSDWKLTEQDVVKLKAEDADYAKEKTERSYK